MYVPAQQFAIEILKIHKYFNKIQNDGKTSGIQVTLRFQRFIVFSSTDSIVLGTNFAKRISTIASSEKFNIDIIFVMRQKWHRLIWQLPLGKKNIQDDRRQLMNFNSVNRSEFSKILSFFLKGFFFYFLVFQSMFLLKMFGKDSKWFCVRKVGQRLRKYRFFFLFNAANVMAIVLLKRSTSFVQLPKPANLFGVGISIHYPWQIPKKKNKND